MSNDNKKTRLKTWGNVFFVGVVMLALTAGLVRTVFFPKDINDYENRYSNKIIMPTKDNFLDGSFQNSIEAALSDQIPGAQNLKKAYNKITSSFADVLVNPVLETAGMTYVNYKNGSKIFGGYYVYDTTDLESIKNKLLEKTQNYNDVFEKYTDIEFYVYYIEKDTDINFENGKKVNVDDYLFSLLKLDEDRKKSFEIDSFKEFSEYFYKTDHHWKHTGSYAAYKDIVRFLGCEGEFIEAGKEILISEKFVGSKAQAVGSEIITESFYAYEFDFPTFKEITALLQNSDYGNQANDASSYPVNSITYGTYYGGDDGEVIFDTGKTELDNILIIGESYDNAILKLLATHFNKTYSIDLRNYEAHRGNEFNFDRYVKVNDIDKVLLIGNVDFYTLNTFEVEIY